MKANQRKLLILLAVVFWMAIIFKLSAQPGEQSNILSTKVTTVIVSLAQQFRPDVNVVSLNYFIRKCAHFLAYLVLGIIVLFAMRRIGFTGKKGCSLHIAALHQLRHHRRTAPSLRPRPHTEAAGCFDRQQRRFARDWYLCSVCGKQMERTEAEAFIVHPRVWRVAAPNAASPMSEVPAGEQRCAR